MKNKIAIIPAGFMGAYIDSFLKLCTEHNISVDIYTYKPCLTSEECVKNVFLIESVPEHKNIKKIKESDKKLKTIINPNSYDYVLSDGFPLSFACNIFHGATTKCKIQSTKNFLYRFIVTLGHFNRLRYEKSFFRNCPKTVAVSSVLRDDYAKNCNIDRNSIIVAHPGMSFVKNTKDYTKPDLHEGRYFIIGINANGFTTKGGYVLLKALYLLKKQHPSMKIKAKIIHEKFKKNYPLKLYLKLLNLESTVEFCTFQKDMEKFYRSLNCLVCPSKYEAFGRIVAEAMNYKIPVITSQAVGASDIIKDGINGFLYKSGKNECTDLANTIKTVYEKYSELDTLTDEAWKTVRNITWENFAKTIFSSLYISNSSDKIKTRYQN